MLWTKKPSVETLLEKVQPFYPLKFHLWYVSYSPYFFVFLIIVSFFFFFFLLSDLCVRFLKVFRDPKSWFEARLVYCSTLAVMSMVGMIVGYTLSLSSFYKVFWFLFMFIFFPLLFAYFFTSLSPLASPPPLLPSSPPPLLPSSPPPLLPSSPPPLLSSSPPPPFIC